MANVAAKHFEYGILGVDRLTEEYVRSRAKRACTVFESDKDAWYADVIEYDVGKIEASCCPSPFPGECEARD